MSGTFETELSTMRTAAQHVHEVNAQIQAQLSNLLSRLDPLMGSWQGAAATSFHTLRERWQEDATQLNATLGSIAEGLFQVEGNYQATEESAQQGFGAIARRLG